MTHGMERAGLWMSLLALIGCGGGPSAGSGAGATTTTGGEVASAVALETAVSSINRFTAELYRTIARPDANGAASPYSIAVAFGMVRQGARGETRSELDRALHLDGDASAAFGALAERIDAIGASGVTLRTANRVFVQDGFAVEPATRARINGWVADQTNDRIEELLPPGSIGADTRLVLTNAVYFHGTWHTAFDRARTQELPFFAGGATEVRVPTMQADRAIRFGRFDGVTVGELAYTGGEIAMIVVVPTEREGLGAVLASLDDATMRRWSEELTERPNVTVRLPRFRIAPAASLSLREPMGALGVRLVFQDGRADLTGIADVQPPLFVADGYHKAFVEVNEEGTEAAAATAVVIAVRSAPMRPVERDELIADRPFLFFLRDSRTGAILFVGHVVDPR
jgi:serpin B